MLLLLIFVVVFVGFMYNMYQLWKLENGNVAFGFVIMLMGVVILLRLRQTLGG